MSEFNGITGADGWTEKLGELLADAERAADDGNRQAMRDVRERLQEFTRRSPRGPEVNRLDDIAFAARRDLAGQATEGAVEEIVKRSEEYTRLRKEFEARATENKEREDWLRLNPVRRVIDATNETVNAAMAARDALADSDDADLKKKIVSVLTRLQSMRSELEKLSGPVAI